VPTQCGSDWQRLPANSKLHWKIGRSATTATASWQHPNNQFPPEIAHLLDFSGDEDITGLSPTRYCQRLHFSGLFNRVAQGNARLKLAEQIA
jgi:hypothetical protein